MELVPSYRPWYFATFDFIRPVRAVTVNFMDRSRSRQAHQEVGRSGVENEDEPRRSSSVFQFSLFFLNRRNGKSRLRSFFLFRASRKKRLASVVVIHRFFTVEFCLIVHRLPGSCQQKVPACGQTASILYLARSRVLRNCNLVSEGIRSIVSFLFFFFNSDFVRLGRKLHGWIVGRIQESVIFVK